MMDETGKARYEGEFICSDTTEFYADSVEWCPLYDYEDFLVCGTYQLEETDAKYDATQTRKGGVALYQLCEGETFTLKKIDFYSCSGVLDMKWHPYFFMGLPTLVLACSDGQLVFLQINYENEDSVSLKHILSKTLEGKEKNMILSVDLCGESDSGYRYIVASDTAGCLNYFDAMDDKLRFKRWKAHNFEAWVCAFDYSQPKVIYSGGDDCCFVGFDARDLPTTTFVNKRHTMGVTAISKSRIRENLLVTGSYDENVFLWDTRSINTPLSEVSVKGGVWRLKWNPHDPDYLLSASMHNGFQVLSVTEPLLFISIIAD